MIKNQFVTLLVQLELRCKFNEKLARSSRNNWKTLYQCIQ